MDENITILCTNKGENEKSKFLFFILEHGLIDKLMKWCRECHCDDWQFACMFVMGEMAGVDMEKETGIKIGQGKEASHE